VSLLTITMYDRPDLGAIVCNITAHGVHQGSYGDLWTRRVELPRDRPGAQGALRALAEFIDRTLGSGDGSGLPG